MKKFTIYAVLILIVTSTFFMFSSCSLFSKPVNVNLTIEKLD